MALEYDFELSTDMGPARALELLVRQIDGLDLDEDGSFLFGSTVTIHLSESDRMSQEVIERGFHFKPTLSAVFRFASNTNYDNFSQLMLRATMLLLEHARDAVLLFNYETIVLQRLGGQLAFNSNYHIWDDDDQLRSMLSTPFVRRPLPSPWT